MHATSVAPVVVGVKSSPTSRQAVRLAATEAARHHRPLHLLHAFNWSLDSVEAPQAWSREEAEQVCDQAVREALTHAPDVETTVRIVEGEVVGALLHASRSAALLVVGDGGLDHHISLPIDVVSVQVASRADCPVLLARRAREATGPVLVGNDGSLNGDQALGFAFDAASGRGKELIVVYVVENETGFRDVAADAERAEQLAQWQRKYPDVRVERRERMGDPARLLIEDARSAALTVVGARGERPTQGLLGPVSVDVLHLAPCPVAIVRGRTDLLGL